MAVDAALGVLARLCLGRFLLFTVLLCTSLRERQTSDPLRQLADYLSTKDD